MPFPRLLPVLALLPLASIVGCAPNAGDHAVFGSVSRIGRATSGERWESDDAIRLATTGPIAVEIDSFAGSVLVTTGSHLTETIVRVERAAVHGFSRYDEAGDALAEITYTVDLRRGDSGEEIVAIRTDNGDAETAMTRANVIIETPELDRVRIRTTRGDVQVYDFRGGVDVVTSDGDVRVATNWPARDAVSIVTRDGDVEYMVRGESTAAFDVETKNGEVSHRCRYSRVLAVDQGNRAHRFRGILNGGENPVVIRTTNGDVSIEVVPDPRGAGEFLLGR